MRPTVLTLLFVIGTAHLYGGEKIGFGGEALYWKPQVCSYEFAHAGSLTAAPFADKITSLQPGFDAGVRAFGTLRCGCWETSLSYLYLQTRDRGVASRGGANSFQLVGLISSDYTRGEAHIEFTYQNVDLRLARLVHVCRPWLMLSASINGRWIDMARKARLRGTGENVVGAGTLRQSSKTEGCALGVGLQAESCAGYITTFASFNVMACIETARLDTLERQQINGQFDAVRYTAATYAAPAADFQLGLSAANTVGCVNWGVEIGFESHTYWNALRHAAPNRVNEPLQEEPADCRTVGFAGPYVGLRAQF